MLQPFQPPVALVDQVREAIVDAIVDGSLQPGERLGQVEIAERLGVSRQPVSHALRVLKEQGIVVELGRKGLTVAPIEASHIRNVYEVRGALDAVAARLAAMRMADGELASEDLRTMERLVEANTAPRRRRTAVSRLVEADIEFHVTLYKASANPVLVDLMAPQWIHLRRCMHTVLADGRLREDVWDEHQAILEAVMAGDPDRASLEAQTHNSRAGALTARRLQDAKSQGG